MSRFLLLSLLIFTCACDSSSASKETATPGAVSKEAGGPTAVIEAAGKPAAAKKAVEGGPGEAADAAKPSQPSDAAVDAPPTPEPVAKQSDPADQFDPIPAEGPAVEAAAAAAPPARADDRPHERQVVPFPEGQDPFGALAGPKPKILPETDPRSDTLRLGPQVPPEKGEVVEKFPPDVVLPPPKKVAPPELKVIRHAPEGQVDLAAAVTASFNQPMVPLTSLSTLDDKASPLSIEPLPEGRFAWMGTDTVAFEPKYRLPFGNRFTATVKAGVTSPQGKALSEAFSWTFETPRPALEYSQPATSTEGNELDLPIKLTFNAAMDPAAVLKHARLAADGGKEIGLRLAPDALPKPKETGNVLVDNENRVEWARTVVLKPVVPLPAGTWFTLTIGADLASAEGPLPMGTSASVRFATYFPLAVQKIYCDWNDGPCYPGAPITVEFNNRLKRELKPLRLVKITPDVGELVARIHGQNLIVYGEFEPSATYKFELLPGMVDVFGQTDAKGGKDTVVYQEANPTLSLQKTGLVVLEAKEDPHYLLSTMNQGSVQYRLATVPEDMLLEVATRRASTYWWDEEHEGDVMKGMKVVLEKTFDLSQPRNKMIRTNLPLEAGLDPNGHGIVFMEVKTRVARGFFDWRTIRQMAMVMVTNIGLTLAKSYDEYVVMATALDSAAPMEGIDVDVFDCYKKKLASGVTDKSGLARMKAAGMGGSACYALAAGKDGDLSFLPLQGANYNGYYYSNYSYYYGSGDRSDASARLSGFVFTDRGLYRPAEEVSLHVIARVAEPGPEGDLRPLTASERQCSYVINDPRGNQVFTGSVALSAFGTGSFAVTPVKDAPLGTYYVTVSCSYGSASGQFDVEEFRTPEFKTEAEFLLDGSNLLVYREVKAKVVGKYYFGSPMAEADVEWRLTRAQSYYAPPGNGDYSFSDIDPDPPAYSDWGGYWDEGERQADEGDSDGPYAAEGSGKLNRDGELLLDLKLDPGKLRFAPVSFVLEAEVYDKNRQVIAGRTQTIAHWAERYVGLRVDRTVVSEGESIEVSGIVTRLDGSRFDGADVTIDLMQAHWDSEEGVNDSGDVIYTTKYRETRVGGCRFKTDGGAGMCRLVVPKPGTWVVRATTFDVKGRKAASALNVWAYGEGMEEWTSKPDNKIELVPDKKSYEPGEKAKLLIQSPFKEASGLVVVSREGFVSVQPLEIKNANGMVEIPIEERFMPSLTVGVALARGRTEKPGVTRDDRGRPQFAWQQTALPVSMEKRKIQIKVRPASPTLPPGGTLKLDLETTDASGQPVLSNVALMVVDEGVLSLIAYSTPNPLAALYTYRDPGTGVEDNRPLVVPRVKPKVEMEVEREEQRMALQEKAAEGAPPPAPGAVGAPRARRSAPEKKAKGGDKDGAGGWADDEAEAAPAFALREIFKSTAYFNGALQTAADGKLSVEVKMPDNLTEFRIMAVAADETVRFGSNDSQVAIRLPVMVRPALPRFLNYGDRFEAACVVNNETGFDTDVMVRLLAENAEIEGANVQTLSVPYGGAGEVRFQVKSKAPGPATFQFAALALTKARWTDAAELTIPVLIPATSEAFATYGVVEEATVQPIEPPADAIPEYGGLDVALSSTALTGLQDAVKYLFDYPYECTEQICSRILPVLALGDVIRDFRIGKAETPEEARKLVASGIEELMRYQRSDGGFGSWPDSDYSWMYLTAYAVMTLDWAQKKDFAVDETAVARALDFLEGRLDHPHDWEVWAYDTQAMAVMVLARLERNPKKHLDRLYHLAYEDGKTMNEWKQDLSLYARAWLLEAMWRLDPKDKRIEELYRQISNAAVEKASSIHFAEGMRESLKLMMHTEDRSDGIILNSLLVVRPDDPMIPKIVRGLIRARVNGRWSTTQANAYALLALAEYYRIFEKEVPNFKAILWMDKIPVLSHLFEGREMTIVKTRVPMKFIFESAAKELILAKTGPGRLYYRLGLKYAPKELNLKPDDRGFLVERVYMTEDGSKPLEKSPDGAWTVKAGTNLRVKLMVVASDSRYYVAVVDPLPAGLEGVNERFATTAKTRQGGGAAHDEYYTAGWWGWWDPWDYTEMRDDRIQLFVDRMYGGVYEYSYVARATTIGTFVVPPTRAEEMYEPETFGRTGSDRFVVQP